ncbi:imidazole glycerol phosphate synthase subunit HisH [Maricaulis sp.]|uniref:imidazole glycerol phosphate synthase subunit HisH n=1 Tax=Maricaulis sp. TaxID=1486257 RepID=UPI0026033C54|nr:imidazole glycerol phosphate synthase subunit HisH [Maricaulis sp.]
MTIGLIDTGCANIASVRFALERAGLNHVVVRDADETGDCDRLILPGVGAAGPAMDRLRARGWDVSLRIDGRPLLGICLGMQLLFETSDEGNAACLELLPGQVRQLPRTDGLVWPHMGWNTLEAPAADEPLLRGIPAGTHVYFVHGFYVPAGAVTRAQCDYGAAISAIVRREHVSGCQFHPERSGLAGARILSNFASI